MICDNIALTKAGDLTFAGVPVADLARQYGTPLYLYDEDRVRERVRTYMTALAAAFGEGGYRLAYASKAASFQRMYRVLAEEGASCDAVSVGEIATALAASFPPERIFFHSSNKTDADIAYALDRGVGVFVVDNEEEFLALDRAAGERGKKQNILLRLTPGIDPHTYEAVSTGKVDSKFGFAIGTGAAERITKRALSCKNLSLLGFHCHVGSQVFTPDVFLDTACVMLGFCALARDKFGFEAAMLNLGGGFGVRYTEDQATADIPALIAAIADRVGSLVSEYRLAMPVVCFEPGRSIVADAGMTVYEIGSVKRIEGYKTYVSVDGGMTDNPRVALYGAKYTFLPVKDACRPATLVADVVGRCCESGDVLGRGVALPDDLCRGDLLACLTTGAYHYSMASNYNRVPRPPIVVIAGGKATLAVRRETPEDLLACEVL